MQEEMDKLLDLFRREGVEYELYEHEPVYTSERPRACVEWSSGRG
jgi:hypothetical protein